MGQHKHGRPSGRPCRLASLVSLGPRLDRETKVVARAQMFAQAAVWRRESGSGAAVDPVIQCLEGQVVIEWEGLRKQKWFEVSRDHQSPRIISLTRPNTE